MLIIMREKPNQSRSMPRNAFLAIGVGMSAAAGVSNQNMKRVLA